MIIILEGEIGIVVVVGGGRGGCGGGGGGGGVWATSTAPYIVNENFLQILTPLCAPTLYYVIPEHSSL